MREPFVVRAHHRFVVTRAHDDAVSVGKPGIVRVVLVEGIRPHGGPQVIGAQAQQQLEHVRVHLRIPAAKFFARPLAQRRLFVIDEDAAVFHGRRPLDPCARAHEAFEEAVCLAELEADAVRGLEQSGRRAFGAPHVLDALVFR